MTEEADKTIDEIFDEGTAIDDALRKAAREALLLHKRLGNPIAVWEGSRVVWIPPEEIQPEEVRPEENPGPRGT